MQNSYTYTKYFQLPDTYDENFAIRFIKAMVKLSAELESNPPEETKFTSYPWELPYHKKYSDDYYNIIYNIASVCKVKVMYKDQLYHGGSEPFKGLEFHGEDMRCNIMRHVMTYFFKGYFAYKQNLRTNKDYKEEASKFKDLRLFIRFKLDSLRGTVLAGIRELVTIDLEYNNRLENYLLEQLKLNVKNFSGERPMYYNTISKKYHHRRMML